MHSMDYVTINLIVKETELIISLVPNEKYLENIKWRVVIIHDKKVIEDFAFGNYRLLNVKLCGEGMYLVRVYVSYEGKTLDYTQKSIRYYSEETKHRFNEYIRNIDPKVLHKDMIPLYCPKYPYQNMAVICSKDDFSSWGGVKELIRDYHFNLNEISSSSKSRFTIITQDKSVFEYNPFFFSGKVKYDGQIIIGQNEIKDNSEIDSLLSGIGLFTAIYANKNKIIFTNDFFGLYRIYYFMSNDLSVISNNYHMLLLLLKRLNICCQFNVDETLPLLLASERGLLEQRFTHDMDVVGIKQLPIDKYIEIDKFGISIKKKSLSEILNATICFNLEEYERYVKKATEDIKDNVLVGLKDKRYNRIIVDLTGGKDSRTVLAALTNVDNGYREKIVINSKDVSSTKDKKIFIGLNNIFNYNYDNVGDVARVVKIEEKEKWNRSFFMGSSYSRPQIWDLICEHTEEDRCLRFTGAGEMILRPTLSSSLSNLVYNKGVDEFIESLLLTFENSIVDINSCKEILVRQLKEILNELPGTCLKEKFNNHFFFFRNVYHFGMETIMDSIESDCEQWQPLWSPNALIAFRMCRQKYDNLKLQIDLIGRMNPILSVLPFESEKDNIEINKIKNVLSLSDSYKNVKILFDENESKWKKAAEEKRNARKILNDKEEKGQIEEENRKYRDSFYEHLFTAFSKLMIYKNGIYAKSIGLDLFYFLSQEKKKYEGKNIPRSTQFMFNKIISLIDEIEIVDFDIGW